MFIMKKSGFYYQNLNQDLYYTKMKNIYEKNQNKY